MDDIVFLHAPVGLALLEHRIVKRCNLRFAAIFESTVEALENTPIADLYPSSEEYEKIGNHLQDLSRDIYNDERIMRRCGGDLFWCRVRGQSLSQAAPFQTGVWSFADLSEERPVVALTLRERDVAILTCKGLSAKEIGRMLDLSYRTVETHRARLLEKFGAKKLPELVAKLSGMPL